MYYMGGDGPHFGARNTFLQLATLRMDGFAGEAPSDASRAATITTRPLNCACEPPTLTVDVGPGGAVRVAVLAAGNGAGTGAGADAGTDAGTDPWHRSHQTLEGKKRGGSHQALQGRTLDDSVPLRVSATRAQPTWKFSPLSAQAPIPQTCVLMFELVNATLFTFGWPEGEEAMRGSRLEGGCDGRRKRRGDTDSGAGSAVQRVRTHHD